MHTIIFSDQYRQAKFIQKGLRYENLTSEVLPQNVKSEHVERLLQNIDGVFIYQSFSQEIQNLIISCKRTKTTLPIVILSQNYQQNFDELKNNRQISNYFIRPFPFRVIAAEMRFYVFQTKEHISLNVLKLRNLQLNRNTREVLLQQKPVYLRNKEFALLEFLMMNPGRILSRETILESVWDRNANLLTNTVDVHINKLRQKIDYPFEENYIHTIPCSGYIFS